MRPVLAGRGAGLGAGFAVACGAGAGGLAGGVAAGVSAPPTPRDSVFTDHGHRCANGNLVTRLGQRGGKIAIQPGGHFHRALVGLDLEQDIIGGHRIAQRLLPADQQATVLRHAKLRHGDRAPLGQGIIRM